MTTPEHAEQKPEQVVPHRRRRSSAPVAEGQVGLSQEVVAGHDGPLSVLNRQTLVISATLLQYLRMHCKFDSHRVSLIIQSLREAKKSQGRGLTVVLHQLCKFIIS